MTHRERHLVICADCEGTDEQIGRLVAAMARADWRATFFFVGETARAYPSLVRDVAAVHAVHSHTWSHQNLRRLGPAAQREEIMAGRHEVEQCIGRAATGFRAPMHFLNRTTVDILGSEGFTFDASNLYFRYRMGRVVEFPPTWFREWMPLYDRLKLAPRTAFGVFRTLARAARLPVLPAHPHYAGRDDTLAAAFGDFLLWARDAGFVPATLDELMEWPAEELVSLIGWQEALRWRGVGSGGDAATAHGLGGNGVRPAEAAAS